MMRYCADSWFLLSLFDRHEKALGIVYDVKNGKSWLIVPTIVYAETMKKLMRRGVSEKTLTDFFMGIGSDAKIQLISLDVRIAAEAARVSNTSNTAMVDSVVAATHSLLECDVLLSGDSDYAPLVKRKYLKTQSW